MKLLSLLWNCMRTLSVAAFFKIFRFHNRISSYHTLGLFASRGGTFSLNFTVLLVFWPKVWYCKRNILLKGGYTQMGWNGCIFFKKGQI